MCGSVGERTSRGPSPMATGAARRVWGQNPPRVPWEELLALLGENRVDLAAALVEQLADLFLLALVGGVEDLADRVVQLAHRVLEVDRLGVRVGADGVPGGLLTGLLALLGGAGLGEGEAALPVALLTADQPLVLEHLQGGVDRAGAGGPGPAGSLLELFDHLVAVHRPLGEQGEDGGPDVAAPRPHPAAATAAVAARPAAARVLLA